ncbi:PQQ-binding-like beta-propeller repeat protein, partial [Candidatus Binatia bacterium]|nr:PQQ-binding-like beta-propeller repeat protein [Candidatus Binatia bacterium]
MTALRCVIAAASLAAVAASSDAGAWQARVGGVRSLADHGPTIAADGRDDFFAIESGGVVKYRGATGRAAWRAPLEPFFDRDFSRLAALAADAGGDVVVVGALPATDRDDDEPHDAVAFKLSGSDGRVLWRTALFPAGSPDSAAGAVAVDPAGDVVLLASRGNQRFAMKLDGRSGAALWSRSLTDERDIGLRAFLLRVDLAGRIVVAGDHPDPVLQRTTYDVAGLDAASGSTRWQWMSESVSDGGARRLALAPDGTVVATTETESASGTDALVVALDATRGTPRWQRTLDDHRYDSPLAVATDEAGNVFVGGLAYDGDAGGTGAFVTALDAAGRDRWTLAFPAAPPTIANWIDTVGVASGTLVFGGSFGDSGNQSGSFAAIAVDPATGRQRWRIDVPQDPAVYGGSAFTGVVAVGAGSILLGGVIDTQSTRNDDVLLRVDAATGAEAWRTIHNGTAASIDGAVAVAIDPHDDVVVAGSVGTATQDDDVLVVKYDGGDGRELWRATIDGELPFETGEYATAVAADASGDVFVVGRLFDYDRRYPGLPAADSALVKLDGRDGTELWRRLFLAPDGVPLRALRVLPEGDPVLAGRLDAGYEASVVRLDGRTGEEVWRTPLVAGSSAASDGTATAQTTGDTQPFLLEQAGAGGIVATGQGAVFALDATGGQIVWQAAPENFLASALALDRGGNALLAGSSYEGLRVVALDAHDGHEVWRSADTTTDFPRGTSPLVAADASGHALVALNAGTESRPRLAATKIEAPSGATRWTRTLTDRTEGRANAIAVTGGGDLVVAGWLERLTGVRDFAVLRLRGATGTTLWQRRIPSDAGDNAAFAVALDSAEDVIAVGTTFGAFSGQDATTVALDGANGSLSGDDGRGDCPSLPRLLGSRTKARAATAAAAPAEP